MSLTIDFTETENMPEGQFELLDPGIYEVEVFEASETEAQSGRNGLNVQFKITEERANNRRVFRTWWLPMENEMGTEKAGYMMHFLKKFLNTVNPEIDTEGELDLDPSDIIGLPCRVQVAHEEYNGEERDVVDSVLAPTEEQRGGGNPEWLPDDDIDVDGMTEDDDIPF